MVDNFFQIISGLKPGRFGEIALGNCGTLQEDKAINFDDWNFPSDFTEINYRCLILAHCTSGEGAPTWDDIFNKGEESNIGWVYATDSCDVHPWNIDLPSYFQNMEGYWNKSPLLNLHHDMNNIPAWLNPNISVKGDLAKGNTVSINANVANDGKGSATGIKVDFFWGDPSLVLKYNNIHYINTATKDKIDAGTKSDFSVDWTIQEKVNSGHECLVAVIGKKDVPYPIEDRRVNPFDWNVAQRNITVIEARTALDKFAEKAVEKIEEVEHKILDESEFKKTKLDTFMEKEEHKFETVEHEILDKAKIVYKFILPKCKNDGEVKVRRVNMNDYELVLKSEGIMSVPKEAKAQTVYISQPDSDPESRVNLGEKLSTKAGNEYNFLLNIIPPEDNEDNTAVMYFVEFFVKNACIGGLAVVVKY